MLTVVRYLGLALVAAALFAASVTMLGNAPDRDQPAWVQRNAPPQDNSRSLELRRCRDLGEAALQDQQCVEAWQANRRRFFGTGEAEQSATAEGR
ncbi:MAG: hypothetical protein AcusKO_02540 [Acuticoccus sp.]